MNESQFTKKKCAIYEPAKLLILNNASQAAITSVARALNDTVATYLDHNPLFGGKFHVFAPGLGVCERSLPRRMHS